MPDELWERLHGTVRYVDAMTGRCRPARGRATGRALVGPGIGRLGRPRDATRSGSGTSRSDAGSRVLLRPGARRADAHDLFLAGRQATVAAVLHDVDGHQHLAVTVDDDPGADLKAAHGRLPLLRARRGRAAGEVEWLMDARAGRLRGQHLPG